MIREQHDDTAYMRTKWRCSACGGVNSMELDNVCQRCTDAALTLDAKKLSALAPRLYDGPEHESLRAVWRCMIVNFGAVDANRRLHAFLNYFKAHSVGELSPEGANYARKLLERQLPLKAEFAQ